MPRGLTTLALLLTAVSALGKISTKRDMAFGPNVAQKTDVYAPSGGPPPPLVVFVHGGAWIGGDKREYAAQAEHLAGQGVMVAVVNYRLSPDVRHPEHARDLAAALAKLRAESKNLRFDDKRIFLLGHSAGAHMLAYVGSALKAGPIAGYIGLSGIYDIPELVKRRPGYKGWFIATAFGEDEAAWKLASPANLTPPAKSRWLLIHSVRDELVEPAQTDRYATYLTSHGAKIEVVAPESLSHFETVLELAKPASDVSKAVVRFVKGAP